MNPVGGSKVVSEGVDVVLLALALGPGFVLPVILSHGMDHTELVAIGRIIQVREQLGFSQFHVLVLPILSGQLKRENHRPYCVPTR